MRNGWDDLLHLLPKTLVRELEQTNLDGLRELRIRAGNGVELNYGTRQVHRSVLIKKEDISHILNTASGYSPWQAETMAKGYLTVKGGHRIGICGETIVRDGRIQGIRNPESICIRIARDIVKIGEPFSVLRKSLLLLGRPGTGKTTLLRDIARVIAERETVSVLDERDELFPEGFLRGKRMDVLRLCPKAEGMDMVLRTMGPEWICMDEITNEEDAEALLRARNCGVMLLATAHAADLRDMRKRSIYRKIMETDIFDNIVVLRKDNNYLWERKETWT